MDKFKNKYRTESTRLNNWDYASAGYYYVTVCTYNRECLFGEINNGKMTLNACGENVRRDAKSCVSLSKIGKIAEKYWIDISGHFPVVELDVFVVMPNDKNNQQWKSNSLGSIMNQYKSICTKGIRKLHDVNFRWQSRFYDHVIRDDKSLRRIREYIINNPINWQEDKEKERRFSGPAPPTGGATAPAPTIPSGMFSVLLALDIFIIGI